MNKLIAASLLSLVALSTVACGKRTETETKTTVIERQVTVPASSPAASEPAKDGHLQRAGEKIDAKVDRKIDEAIDKSIGE